ncbi:MAG: pilus assembly protein PilY, partial [Aquificota bacterium]
LNVAGGVFDKIFQIFFDEGANETKVAVLRDSDVENSCTLETQKSIRELKPIFDAGCQLAIRNPSDRKIYFNKNGTLTEFTTSEASDLKDVWQSAEASVDTEDEARCIIRYLRGERVASDSSCSSLPFIQRSREFDSASFGALCPTYSASSEVTWKLGDIVYSTPAVVSGEPNNIYHLRYNDGTYLNYIRQDAYKNRTSFIFIGANDGMLHAFRLGKIKERKVCSNDTNRTCTIDTDCSGGYCMPDPEKPVEVSNSPSSDIGKEEWAFIPKNALPYLVWLGRNDYCHVPTVDYRLYVFDASINGSPNDNKQPSSWRTLLVGTMGFGGRDLGDYSSSIFVLDLTDWLNGTADRPSLLWEKSLPDKTLTTSYPAIVRLGDPNKNGEWYLVIGTGPLYAGDKPGVGGEEEYANQAKLYFFDLRNGNLVKSIDIPGANIAVGDIAVVDVDNDYRDDVIYFGVYGKDNSGRSVGGFYRLSLR